MGLAALMLCSDATGKGPACPGLECYEGKKKGNVLENGQNTFIQQLYLLFSECGIWYVQVIWYVKCKIYFFFFHANIEKYMISGLTSDKRFTLQSPY